MFPSRSLSQKIGSQGPKNSTQCFNIPPIQQFTLKISQPLPQLNLPFSDEFMSAVLEKHLHYVNQYADKLETKISQLEFATQIRLRLFVMQALMKVIGRVMIAIITIAAFCKIFRYKITIQALFAIWIVQPTQAASPTTLQGLHNTLLYIRFRKVYSWLPSGLGTKQYEEMESALIDTIIKLRQIVTPSPTTTTTMEAPIFQTNDERIHGILHSLVNKTLNKDADEREEKRHASGLTKQQEQMYATE
jgi:hypothetical protein